MGMAALLAGAAQSYHVVDDGGRLQARVDGNLLPNLQARTKHLATRFPGAIDIEYGKLLTNRRMIVKKKIGNAALRDNGACIATPW